MDVCGGLLESFKTEQLSCGFVGWGPRDEGALIVLNCFLGGVNDFSMFGRENQYSTGLTSV